MNTNLRKKLLALGECMIELSHTNNMTLKMGFAGDTSNTAVYLARYCNSTNIDVFYATALGDDVYSNQMIDFWNEEGIHTQLVHQIPQKLPGLYLIRTNAEGERTFYFYRSESAARQFFHVSRIDKLEASFLEMDIIFFSGIGLAIWDESSRNILFDLIKKSRKAGKLICFDSNYRANLWPDIKLAQQIIKNAWANSDIYLPTFEDHQALFQDTSPDQLAYRLIQEEHLKEVIVKAGDQGCWVGYQNEVNWVPAYSLDKSQIVDTTGAGDSFNAGYLSARLLGLTPLDAAKKAHQLAARVVGFKGAIIPRTEMPSLT